ncbi:MAG: uracil-DNA glycosylase family protein [Nannocystaceae bacterium]
MEELVRISRRLSRAVDKLSFADPVTHVYNPLDYARAPHEAYLERFGGTRKEVVLVGMNPGPFGMAQTGVPFGQIEAVRDWMGIEKPVRRIRHAHPKRPIEGFACTRSEVSGARLWGWAKARFPSADRFFARFFVLNYCPLVFLEASGRNRTPDKLPKSERQALERHCDAALVDAIACLKPRHVVGVGGFAEKKIRTALTDCDACLGTILHPSPASPLANRGWAPAAEAQLRELGIQIS